MTSPCRIGLDLDNTVIDYSHAYSVIAENLGLPKGCRDRNKIRSFLRVSPPNDFEWQKFQALLYTEGLEYATPAANLLNFLEECLQQGVRVFIISHKTRRTSDRFGGHDLRLSAMKWLETHNVTPHFIQNTDVYFCSTREEKIHTINDLQIGVFLDDLSEVLTDPGLPASLIRWLFVPETRSQRDSDLNLRSTDFGSLTEWLRKC